MNLNEWIQEKGWSKVEFAKRFGVSRGAIYKWLGGKKPSKYSLKRLEKFTDGKVKFNESEKNNFKANSNSST